MKLKLRALLAFSMVLAALVSSCGGGGGGGTDENAATSLPSGITTSPADGDTEIDLSPSITVTFSKDIDEATLSSSTFTLTGPKGAVEGDVTYDAATKTASFTPKFRLASTVDYTATISTGIMTKSSALLASDYLWTFTTRARKWGTPQIIESNTETSFRTAKTAINDRGDAIAIWTPTDGIYVHLWANTYTLNNGWGTPTPIVEDVDVTYSDVGIDNEGNAIIVWLASYVSPPDESRMAIYASRYTPAGGWETAQRVDTNTGNAEKPSFAMSASGYATVTWVQDAPDDIMANRYAPGTGWATPQVVDEESERAHDPSVAMDAAGNAIVVWEQYYDGAQSIWSKLYTVGEGWGTGEVIDDTTDTRPPNIVMSENGNAVAIWEEFKSSCRLAANRFVAGEGWSTPQIISYSCSIMGYYDLAVDNDGNIVIIGIDADETTIWTWFNHYTAGGDWSAANPTDGGDVTTSLWTQIGVDGYGNFLLARVACTDPSCDVVSSNLTSDGTWGTGESIEPDGLIGDIIGLSMSSSGDAAAVLQVYNGANQDVGINFYQ